MNRSIPTFLILLIASNQVEAYGTATLCIHACKNTALDFKKDFCHQCAVDPPINHNMCQFACGTHELNAENTQFLDIICEKCFEEFHIMTNICWDCGDPKLAKKSRLCGECNIRGFIMR